MFLKILNQGKLTILVLVCSNIKLRIDWDSFNMVYSKKSNMCKPQISHAPPETVK